MPRVARCGRFARAILVVSPRPSLVEHVRSWLFGKRGDRVDAQGRPRQTAARTLHAPAAAQGDRTTCLCRDGTVVITSWSAARSAWPRCRLLDTHGGGSGLLVDEELARAVRTE